MPIFTLIFSAAVFADERLTGRALAGVALGIAGVVLLTGGASGFNDSDILGDLAVVVASACYASAAILVRLLVRSVEGIVVGAAQVALSAALLLPISLAFGPPDLDLSWDVWLSLLSLGAMSTGVAYIAYYWLIEHTGSFRASLVTYIIPVVGVILGALVLDEEVTASTVMGGLVIVLGVALATGALEGGLRSLRTNGAFRRQSPVRP
jgi:drug/metabolite transporter (DMT)-like permease